MNKQSPWNFVEEYYTDNLEEMESPESKFYLSFLKNIKGKKILCFGCGPNLYDDASFYGSIPEELVGIDINRNNIEFLKKSKNPQLIKYKEYLIKKGVKIKLIVGDIFKTKKEFTGKFDCVYAIGVITNFKKDKLKELLGIVHSYLKPNGIFLSIDWTEDQLSEEKYKERLSYGWYLRVDYSINDIMGLIKNSGLKMTKHGVYNVPNPKEYLWGKIYGCLAIK